MNFKYIKNTQNDCGYIYEANNDVVNKRIDDLVFQYIKKHFNIKNEIVKENIITFITLNYTVNAVNDVTNQVANLSTTVSAHGNFIVEQGMYNDEIETDKANCTLIIKDLSKLDIMLESEGQKGRQILQEQEKTEELLQKNGFDLKTIFDINSFSSHPNTICVRFHTQPDINDIYRDIYIEPQYRLFWPYHCVVVVYLQRFNLIISLVLCIARGFPSNIIGVCVDVIIIIF